jgi:integrase
VLVWLKAHGVNARKPLHALRKEYGPLINEKYDLVTAKELLRHSSVAMTAAHYVENRKRGTTGLGALLKTKRKGKKIVQFKDAQTKPPATSGKFVGRPRKVKTRNP